MPVEAIFEITNVGDEDLTLGQIAVDLGVGPASLDFAITSDDCSSETLAAEASCTFGVTFTPLAEGLREAIVRIPFDHPDSPLELRVQGTGVPVDSIPETAPVAQASPTSITASPIGIGVSTYHQMVVSNVGDADLHIDTAAIVGGEGFDEDLNEHDDRAFEQDGSPWSGQTLTPGQSIPGWLEFNGTSAGVKEAELVITSDDAASPLIVPLYGEVVDPPPPPPEPYVVNRFYLSRMPAPAGLSTPNGNWAVYGSDALLYLSPVKGGAAVQQISEQPTITGQPTNVRLARWISPPLAAQDLSGWTFRCIAQAAAASGFNVQSRILFRRWNALTSDTTHLTNIFNGSTGAGAWSTTTRNQRFRPGNDWQDTIGPSAVFAANDRLIVELGARVYTNGASPNLRIRRGAAVTDTDASDTELETVARAGWFDLCPGILVLPEPLPA